MMRKVTFEPALKVTKRCELLKKDEVRRVEEQVDANLTARGCLFHGLNLPAKFHLIRQDAKKKEDRTNGEHETDTAKHFKLLDHL
jgi:hypothetical protein